MNTFNKMTTEWNSMLEENEYYLGKETKVLALTLPRTYSLVWANLMAWASSLLIEKGELTDI